MKYIIHQTGGSDWSFVGVSDNLLSSYNWLYPSDLTTDAMISVCVTDSFGHMTCDTCGPFSITGDIESPTGYAYADTCSPDSVFIILHDDTGIDWSNVCIQDPVGVLCYPDSMRMVGDSMIVFYPRLPDVTPLYEGYYFVKLFSATDLSGNSVHESIVVDSLTPAFRHPCCYPLSLWLECPDDAGLIHTSCIDQDATFGISSSHDITIDTMRVYIRRQIGTTETLLTPGDMDFSISGDTTWVSIPGSYSEGDSVWIMLDSLFTERGCKTAP